MNRGLKSNGHKHSPYNRIYIEILHFVSQFAIVSLSHIRENFLKMWNVGSRYMEIVWPCWANTVDVWVSPDATNFLVLFKFSWKRRNSWPFSAATSLLVLLSISASFCHTWELDAASWLGSLATGALSVPGTFRWNWTLHSPRTYRNMRDQVQRRFGLCHNSLFSFLFLHPFSPSFQGSRLGWNSESSKLSWNGWCQTSGEDCSTHHMWNCPFVNMSAS